MKITEKQIENLIYENPWILDERYIVPKIPGSGGKYGRQINIGKKRSRFIDLLFKDTRDNRPVIIELKKGSLNRVDIAQTLEYRSLLASIDDDKKELWSAEFGQNFFAPKMMLIGSIADDETILSANLAGVEIRTFGNNYENEIGFETFRELRIKLKEWNDFRNSGNRTLIERGDWVEGIVNKLDTIVQDDFDDIITINEAFKIKGNKCYLDYVFPFLNIPVFYNDEILIGLYEYYDDEFPFSERIIYCDYSFAIDRDSDELIDEKDLSLIKKIMSKTGFKLAIHSSSSVPSLLIARDILENENEFRKAIISLINNALEVYRKLDSH